MLSEMLYVCMELLYVKFTVQQRETKDMSPGMVPVLGQSFLPQGEGELE